MTGAPFSPSFAVRSIADVHRLEAVPMIQAVPVRSTYELLCNTAAAFGDKTAITFLRSADPAEAPLRWSYRDSDEASLRMHSPGALKARFAPLAVLIHSCLLREARVVWPRRLPLKAVKEHGLKE